MELIIDTLPLLGQLDGQGLADGLRGFALPIVLVVIGVGGLIFLGTQQASRFVSFLVVGIFVVALITTPGLIQGAGEWVGGLLTR